MRKTTQSMYQGTKMGGIEGSGLIKSAIGGQRKIEGNDLFQTSKKKGNFEQTVKQLKKKPAKKVIEDEYISGLQEEIKYLQYELKLLKDKELIERQGVNELDNFLKDEIPINENILAMKNKYNNTKAKLDSHYQDLVQRNSEAQGVLVMQKGEVDKLHQIINTHRKQVAQRKQEFRNKLSDLMRELSLTKDQYESLSRQNKHRQQNIKKLNEQIATLYRAQEKQKVQEVRAQQEKEKQMQKLGQNSKIVRDDLVEAEQKLEEMEQLGEVNPLLEALQQQNSTLRKKIMLNEKQKSTAENIIAEVELFMKEQARERETERQMKGKIVAEGEKYRVELQHLERYVETLIKDQTIRTKKKMMKDMRIELTEKEEHYQQLTDRLRNLEQECSNLIQEKKQLTDAIQGEKSLGKQFSQKINEYDDNSVKNRSKTLAFSRITTEVTNETAPIESEAQKCKGRIPIVEREIEKKKTMIHHLNKQVDLLKQLKMLDMEQLQMISKGGVNVQHTLHAFIKNWEKIKAL